MSLFKGRRRSPAPLIGIRGPERLESREVPAALLASATNASRQENALLLGNGDTDILGTSTDGQFSLLQSTATNLVANQQTPPGEVNLFVYSRADSQNPLTMVSPGNNPVSFGGVERSIPGQKLNAVLSADGASVAFLSSVPSNILDLSLGTGATDSGGIDVFRWKSGNVVLVSRDSKGAAANGVTNPAISSDGTVVSFVSTADAGVITGNANYVDGRAYGTTPLLVLAGTSALPSTSVGASPDLFRAVPGQVPQPVSYSKFQQFGTVANSFARTGVAQGLMNGDVQVDPLGRYMNGNGTGFLFSRTANSTDATALYYPVTTTVNGFSSTTFFFSTSSLSGVGTQGVWRYAFSSGTDPVTNRTPVVSTNRSSGGSVTVPSSTSTFPSLAAVAPVAKVQNAAGATQSLTAVFDYTRLDGSPSFVIDNLAGTTAATVFTPGIQTTQLYKESGNDFVMVSHTSSSKTVGGNGPLSGPTTGTGTAVNADPGGYSIYKDGSRVLFTSAATDLDARLPALPADTVNQVYEYVDGGTTLVSLSSLPGGANSIGVAGNRRSTYPVYNQTDGLTAAFYTQATNLPSIDGLSPNVDIPGVASIYLYRRAGRNTAASLQLLSGGPSATVKENGTVPNGLVPGTLTVDENRPAVAPVIGGTTRVVRVYFGSTSTNLTGGLVRVPDGTTTQGYLQEVPPQITREGRNVVLSGGGGKVIVGVTDSSQSNLGGLISQQTYTPFPGWTGEVRVAFGDFNGDGVPDIVCGAGPGGGPRVVILNGFTGRVIRDFFAFEPRFTGGVYVASGDLNGDGRDDIVIGAGEGGGARVQVVNGVTDRVFVDALVYEPSFRGGVRVAVGFVTNFEDSNGNRVPESRANLVTAAGVGGGPRVTVFDGTALSTGRLAIRSDFYAYEPTLRGGVYVSVGDYNFDGIDDVVTGGGPDGGPRVTVFDGTNLATTTAAVDSSRPYRLLDFFAFDSNSREGARPVLKNVTADSTGFADLVVGTGNGYPLVRTFRGSRRTATPEDVANGLLLAPTGFLSAAQDGIPLQTLNPFTAVTLAGAWVG